jgi:hypothetical protein
MSLRTLFPLVRPWTCRTCLQRSTGASPLLWGKRVTDGFNGEKRFGRAEYATGPKGNPWIPQKVKKEKARPPPAQTQSTEKSVLEAVGITETTAKTSPGATKGQSHNGRKDGRPKSAPKPKRRRRLLIASGSGVVIVAAAVAFNDEAKHLAVAVKRTSRVVGTLGVCINEYVTSLPYSQS